jgi:oligopeptide transport system ATP-binding protein
MEPPILAVENLIKHYPLESGLFSKQRKIVHAVDGVSLEVSKSETMGLVGESGCGKTTVGKCVSRLIEPTSGDVLWNGHSLLKLRRDEIKSMRRKIQMVFQDPYSSLTPTMTTEALLLEALRVHKLVGNQEEADKRIDDLLKQVELRPDVFRHRYPHELSGGERQRVVIARALSLNPELVVLDEPVASLDVSVQAYIINLLKDLQLNLRLTFILISHDLNIVRHMCTSIIVMYLGKVVEHSPASELFSNPRHPYTRALLSAAPIADPDAKRERIILTGEVPNAIDPPQGCRFASRCPKRQATCTQEEPILIRVSENHYVACHPER